MKQVNSATAASSRAAARAAGDRNQLKAWARTARAMVAPGMPISPPRASPASSCGTGTAKVVKRAGSRVRSSPESSTGIRAQPSMAAAPARTTPVRAAAGFVPAMNSAANRTARMPSAYRAPRIMPTSCQGLRRRELRSSSSFSFRRCATIPAPPCACARLRAQRTVPPGCCCRGPRQRYRRPAGCPRPPRPRGHTSAGPGP